MLYYFSSRFKYVTHVLWKEIDSTICIQPKREEFKYLLKYNCVVIGNFSETLFHVNQDSDEKSCNVSALDCSVLLDISDECDVGESKLGR